MFGRYPNSGAPITGSSNNVYAQALTYLSTSVATIVRLLTLFRALTVNSTTTATLTRLLSLFKTLSVTSNTTATIAKIFAYVKTLSINSTSTATFIKAVRKIFSTVIESTIALITETASHYLTLAVNSVTTSSFIKALSVIKSVTSTTTATFVRAIRLIKTVTITSTATILKSIGRILSVIVNSTATIRKSAGKILSVTSTSTASFVRAIRKMFATIVDNVLVVLTESAFHLVAFTINITSTSSFKKALSKFLTVSNHTTPFYITPLFPNFNSSNVVYSWPGGGWYVGFPSYCAINVGDTVTVNGYSSPVVAINRNVSMYNLWGSSYVTGDQVIITTVQVAAWGFSDFYDVPIAGTGGVYAIPTLFKALPKLLSVVSSTIARISRAQLKTLLAVSTVTVGIFKFLNKVLTVTVNCGIILIKQINLIFAVLSNAFVIIKRFIISLFGTEGALSFFAIDRLREVVVVKVRNVFAYKGNKDANKK
jgi:hypothetical protein